ncbi:hypothetical protein OJAV_G00012570, partial [Oryzias javanicus]
AFYTAGELPPPDWSVVVSGSVPTGTFELIRPEFLPGHKVLPKVYGLVKFRPASSQPGRPLRDRHGERGLLRGAAAGRRARAVGRGGAVGRGFGCGRGRRGLPLRARVPHPPRTESRDGERRERDRGEDPGFLEHPAAFPGWRMHLLAGLLDSDLPPHTPAQQADPTASITNGHQRCVWISRLHGLWGGFSKRGVGHAHCDLEPLLIQKMDTF